MAFRFLPRTRRQTVIAVVVGTTVTATGIATAASLTTDHPGPRPDGTALTSVGWEVTPVGSQHPVGVFPLDSVWAPHHTALIVGHGSGYGDGITVLDPAGNVLQSIKGPISGGMAFNHAGDHLYVPSGSTIRSFAWDGAATKLTAGKTYGVPGSIDGVTVSADDSALYASQNLLNSVATVQLSTGSVVTSAVGELPGRIVSTPDGAKSYVSNMREDTLSVLDTRVPVTADNLCADRPGAALAESFDELGPKLQPKVDEDSVSDPNLLGWTHEAPTGWTRTVASGVPQGVTEWQGWSFATLPFWQSSSQDRDKFSKGCGIVAVADGDEWDDKGSPSSTGTMDTTLTSPAVTLPTGASQVYVNLASHYRGYAEQKAEVTATFDNGTSTQVLHYDKTNSDETSQENLFHSLPVTVPAGASKVTLSFRYWDAGNDWYWAIDDVSVTTDPQQPPPSPKGQEVLGTVKVGTHPNALLMNPEGTRLYVANGDSDSVSVVDTSTDQVVQTIDLAPYPDAPQGSAPDGLALSPDGTTLYVTEGGADDVAVVDLQDGDVAGRIPTAWYPTSVTLSADGTKIYVTNGKGLGAGPNNNAHPRTSQDPANYGGQPYIVSQLKGTVQIVDRPYGQTLKGYTAKVVANNNYAERNVEHGDGTVVPRRVGQSSPIKHVLWVVKENRTYDQLLGDLKGTDGKPRGNGDPNLAIFGEPITPNTHQLARQFVTFDNLYVNSEVSAQGWQWVTSANSNYLSEVKTIQAYGGTGYPYIWEGGDVIAVGGNEDPKRAYLWDRLAEHHKSFRDYGQFVFYDEAGKSYANDPILDANVDRDYPPYDLAIKDIDRVKIWKQEFDQYVANDNLPSMQFIDLGRDHTAGLQSGQNSPQAMVADNDAALGAIVDTVSHSKYWKDTAIFVVEDDAQAGPDHVDAHRTLGLVISPYTQTGKVDSTFYNQTAMMRTMELILGIEPLSVYDETATPMVNAFSTTPNLTPYNAKGTTFNVNQLNYDSTMPEGLDQIEIEAQPLDRPDAMDEVEFNRQIWLSVFGPNAHPPVAVYNVLPAPAAHQSADWEDEEEELEAGGDDPDDADEAEEAEDAPH